MKSIHLVITAALIFTGVVSVLQPVDVDAQSAVDQIQQGVDSVSSDTEKNTSTGSLVKDIVNMLLFLVGAVAVVMILFSGFKYITSSGDASAVTSAKNTLLYSVIGVIVALLAYAVVNFTVNSFTKKPYEGPPMPTTPGNRGQPY